MWCGKLLALAPVYDPREWGWKLLNDGTYASMWTTLPDISSHCSELVRCSCKNVCRNCKCRRNELRCTKLCASNGVCSDQSIRNLNFNKCNKLIADEDRFSDVDEDTVVD